MNLAELKKHIETAERILGEDGLERIEVHLTIMDEQFPARGAGLCENMHGPLTFGTSAT